TRDRVKSSWSQWNNRTKARNHTRAETGVGGTFQHRESGAAGSNTRSLARWSWRGGVGPAGPAVNRRAGKSSVSAFEGFQRTARWHADLPAETKLSRYG